METALQKFSISHDRRTVPNDTVSFGYGSFVSAPLIPPRQTTRAIYALPDLQPRWTPAKGLRAANTTVNGTVPNPSTIAPSSASPVVNPTPTESGPPAWLEALEGPFRSAGRSAYFWDESLSSGNGTKEIFTERSQLNGRAPIPPLDNWGRLLGPRHSFRFLVTAGDYISPDASSFRNLLAIWHDPLDS